MRFNSSLSSSLPEEEKKLRSCLPCVKLRSSLLKWEMPIWNSSRIVTTSCKPKLPLPLKEPPPLKKMPLDKPWETKLVSVRFRNKVNLVWVLLQKTANPFTRLSWPRKRRLRLLRLKNSKTMMPARLVLLLTTRKHSSMLLETRINPNLDHMCQSRVLSLSSKVWKEARSLSRLSSTIGRSLRDLSATFVIWLRSAIMPRPRLTNWRVSWTKRQMREETTFKLI